MIERRQLLLRSAIMHDDGWSSCYLHLNNDVDGSDDGDGVGIRPDLVVGTRVVAGRSHRMGRRLGERRAVDASSPLRASHAQRRCDRPAGQSSLGVPPHARSRPWSSGRPTFSGPYIDDDGLPAEPMFGLLASLGAVSSCDPWNAAVCPHSEASNLDAVELDLGPSRGS